MERFAGYILPFMGFMALVYWLGSNPIYGAIYLILGIFITIDRGSYDDFSGALSFIFSFHIINKKWFSVPIIITTFISITLRLFNLNETIMRSFLMLVIYLFWYVSYYIFIYRTMSKPIKSKIQDLSQLENNLISDIAAGLSQKEAIYNQGIEDLSKGYDIIRGIKRKMETSSIPSITHKLGEYNASKNRFKK